MTYGAVTHEVPAAVLPDPPSAWIVEDDPAAAGLATDLCEAGGMRARCFRGALPFLAALRSGVTPAVVILDWRLEQELSAALFMATRHRLPRVPVIYWTASRQAVLPAMIRRDPRTRVVNKATGAAAFETALAWALEAR